MTQHLLIVEDDESLRLTLRDNLEEEGYRVSATASGVEAKSWLLEGQDFDLVVLDIMLPDLDGYALARELRRSGVQTPILMLTARTLEDDLVQGFEAGADDFLTKPYRLRELLVRVRALCRRRQRTDSLRAGALRFGDFSLDPIARLVRDADGRELPLTRTELDLLKLFLERQGEALSRHEILDEVWGPEVVIDPRTIDNFVSSLKKKLGWKPSDPYRFTALRGVGYRMEVEMTRK